MVFRKEILLKKINEPILKRSESEANHEQSFSSLTDVQPLPPKRKLATENYETDKTRKLTKNSNA